MQAPAVIVHGLDHVRLALAPGRPVTLLSGPGAAAYAGIGWWRALMGEAAGLAAAPPADILDCGLACGHAIEALREGQRVLVLRARPDVFADIAERAASCGATLLPAPPPALDLAARGGPWRLAAWLGAPP